jgi:protein TonB
MTAHADTLDRAEPLAKPFWGSLFLHISVAAAVLAYGWIGNRSAVQWGDPHGGGMGSVAVNPVSIKLPSKQGPENPVANNADSSVPEPPAKKKPAPKVKAPEPDAIPIKSRNAPKRTPDVASSQPNKFREMQKDAPNQVTSTVGQSLSSRMINMQGGGGLQIGNDSPFGTQFGAYAKLVRDAVARKWNTTEFDSRLTIPTAVVTFVMRRDGSVTPGSVRLTERSGNSALDNSAVRAILDASPFPPLPQGFAKSEAQVELRFNLK